MGFRFGMRIGPVSVSARGVRAKVGPVSAGVGRRGMGAGISAGPVSVSASTGWGGKSRRDTSRADGSRGTPREGSSQTASMQEALPYQHPANKPRGLSEWDFLFDPNSDRPPGGWGWQLRKPKDSERDQAVRALAELIGEQRDRELLHLLVAKAKKDGDPVWLAYLKHVRALGKPVTWAMCGHCKATGFSWVGSR